MKITIVIDAPHYIGGIRYIERFIKILSLTEEQIDLKIIYVNCSSSIESSMPCTEKFVKLPRSLYRLDRLIARFTGVSFFSLYLIKYIKNSNLFFSDVFLPDFLKKKNKVKLIHWFPDFQVYDLEHLFPKNKVVSRKLYIQLQLKTCDYLITQSSTDLERMKNLYPKFAGKIVRWSFAEPKLEIANVDKIEIKNHILKRGEYLFYPHQGWAHKNHLLLIKTIEQFQGETLVLTGRLSDPRNDSYTVSLQDAINSSKASIINLGLVTSTELNSLMKNSKAILNFSSYEGWSSCVEEGVMMGVPLILSNISIHKEQIPDAYFVDISTDSNALSTFAVALNELNSFKRYDYGSRINDSVKSLKHILDVL